MQYFIKGNQVPSTTNHRLGARVALEENLVFRAKNQANHGGLLRDVSEGGLYFFSEAELHLKSELVFYLPLQIGQKKRLCMVAGKVVRQEPAEALSFGYAVQFEKRGAMDSSAMLRDFVVFKTTGFLPERTYPSAILPGNTSPGTKVPPPVKATSSYEPKKFKINTRPVGRVTTEKIDLRAFTSPVKRISKPKSKVFHIVVAALAICLTIGTYIGVQSVLFDAQLSQSVPIVASKVIGDTLRAQVDAKWINETTPTVRREKLSDLYRFLRTKGIQGAVLTTPDGKRVALVMRNINAPQTPRIDLAR